MSDPDVTLHSVLPSHSTKMERALETAGLYVGSFAVDPEHWDPDTCPEAMLPWLAWALSVDVFDSRWPVETRRNMIRSSIEVHRLHGTLGGLRRALEAIGVRVVVQEWFDTGKTPHTFSIEARATVDLIGDVSEPLLSTEMRRQVEQVINSVKPVRSKYEIVFVWSVLSEHQTAPITAVRSRNKAVLATAITSYTDAVPGFLVPAGAARSRIKATMEITV